MKLKDLTEGRDAYLYHAFKEIPYAIQALVEDELLGTTKQRRWKGGVYKTDDIPDYNDSYWMKGISMTRDLNFAKRWGEVVLVLDQRKLSYNYRFIPFNWASTIGGSIKTSHKREREEYLVLDRKPETYKQKEEDGDPRLIDMYMFDQPAARKVKPLHRYMIGFYVNDHVKTSVYLMRKEYKGMTLEDVIKRHPKFLGFYSDPLNADIAKIK